MKRPCFHDWGRWSAPYIDNFTNEGKLLQVRECQACGKAHVARAKQPAFSRSSLADVLDRLKELAAQKGGA